MKNNKIILLLTIYKIPKNGGGPGAVVDLLMRGINVLNEKWRAITIPNKSKSSIPKTKIIFSQMFKKIATLLFYNELPLRKYYGSLILYFFMINRLRKFKSLINEKLKLLDIINVIHCHDILSFFCIHSILQNLKISKPILLSIHSSGSCSKEKFNSLNFEVLPWFKYWLEGLEIKCIKDCSALVFGSNAAKEYLKKDFPYMAPLIDSKSFILYNGIENIEPSIKIKMRDELNLKQCFLCVSVGRLVKIKGYENLIKAIYNLKNITNLHLLLVGDGPLKEYLIRITFEYGLSDKIHFLGFRTDVPNILADSDLYVSSSFAAMFDITLLEAMRAGLPIVASRIGGNIEAIGKDAGILVEPTYEELAKAINILIHDNIKRIELGKKARLRFTSHFTRESMAKKAINIYQNF